MQADPWAFGWDQLIGLANSLAIISAALIAYSGVARLLSRKAAERRFDTAQVCLKNVYDLRRFFESLTSETARNTFEAFDVNLELQGSFQVENQKSKSYLEYFTSKKDNMESLNSQIGEIDIYIGNRASRAVGLLLNTLRRMEQSAVLIERWSELIPFNYGEGAESALTEGIEFAGQVVDAQSIPDLWLVALPKAEDEALVTTEFYYAFEAIKLECEIASGHYSMSKGIKRWALGRRWKMPLSTEQRAWLARRTARKVDVS